MAGMPLSAFFCNVYLMELDAWFEERKILYARYSDDIIVFAEREEQIRNTGSGLLSLSGNPV